MRSVAAVAIAIAINIGLLAALSTLPRGSYDADLTGLAKATIFAMVLSVGLRMINLVPVYFKLGDFSVYNSHLKYIFKEMLKVLIVAFIALYEVDEHWRFRLALSQVLLICAILSSIILIEFVFEFVPSFYQANFHTFLELYDEFGATGSRGDYKQDVGNHIYHSLHNSASDKTLAGLLPKKITFDDTLKTAVPTPHCSPRKVRSCHTLVDKLYSVLPKNTYHLITASASALMTDDLPPSDTDSDSINEVSYVHEVFFDSPDPLSSHLGDALVRSEDALVRSDDSFSGGGGGRFKYQFPDGSKIKFGGGGGFDYNHRGSCSSKSSTLRSSRKDSIKEYFQWLVPMNKENSIKKKLSMFSFDEQDPLVSHQDRKYSATDDLEAQPVEVAFSQQEFKNYLSLSLGLDRFKIMYDPIYERFGSKIIRDLTVVEMILCYVNRLVWAIGTILVYSAPFLGGHHHFFVLVVMWKLFHTNIINRMRVGVGKVLVLKIVGNAAVFGVLLALACLY